MASLVSSQVTARAKRCRDAPLLSHTEIWPPSPAGLHLCSLLAFGHRLSGLNSQGFSKSSTAAVSQSSKIGPGALSSPATIILPNSLHQNRGFDTQRLYSIFEIPLLEGSLMRDYNNDSVPVAKVLFRHFTTRGSQLNRFLV